VCDLTGFQPRRIATVSSIFGHPRTRVGSSFESGVFFDLLSVLVEAWLAPISAVTRASSGLQQVGRRRPEPSALPHDDEMQSSMNSTTPPSEFLDLT